MSDPHPARPQRSGERPAPQAAERRTLFRKLVEFVSPGPDSRDELISTLADAEHRELIAPESRLMLEGVLRMADLTAGDVMVAAPRMDLLDIDAPYDDVLHTVIGTGHSRFPVYEGSRENVIGILMAVNMEVGLCHPPVGLNLYVASGITKMGITELTVAVGPWLLTMIAFLVVVTFWPPLSLWLPSFMK